MKYVLIPILFLLMTQRPPISAQERADVDSLIMVLKQLPDSCKLKSLYDLTYQNLRNNICIIYSNLLLEEADRQHNTYYKGSAYFLSAMYYYAKNADSMRIFMHEAEPLLLSENRLGEICRMRGWNIYTYTRDGQKEKVIPAVDDLKAFAKKYNFPDGEDMANQALADYYLGEGLSDEGVELYEEVLHSMERRNIPLIKQINIIRQLLRNNIDIQKQIYYLDKINGYIEDYKKKGIEYLDSEQPLFLLEYFYHQSYAYIAIRLKDSTLAHTHLSKAEAIMKEKNLVNEERIIEQLKLLYYELIGKYDLAIDMADRLAAHYENMKMIDTVLELLYTKADLYYKSNRGMEAAALFRTLYERKDSVRKAVFYENLAKLKAQHDVDELELKTKQMELEASTFHSQRLLMGSGLIFMVLICCLLVYIAYSRHRHGLQLKVAKEKAEKADRLKSAFLANMNHEIRTPLNAIVGFSQIIADEEDANVRHELSSIIQSNNDLLQRLVEDVLDISKIESDAITFVFAEQDMRALVKDIYNMILLRMPEGVELRLGDCPPLVFYTDRNRLIQILTNLLTNAIKHTEKGYIYFGYEVKEGEVIFSVEDTGEGIPEDQLANIFSRFVKLTEWTKGVGLGLSITKALVEKMHGHIEVMSEVGIGSTFKVIFPLEKY